MANPPQKRRMSSNKRNTLFHDEFKNFTFVTSPRQIPSAVDDNPLQDSCLENSTDRGAWQAPVHGVAESDTTERVTVNIQSS